MRTARLPTVSRCIPCPGVRTHHIPPGHTHPQTYPQEGTWYQRYLPTPKGHWIRDTQPLLWTDKPCENIYFPQLCWWAVINLFEIEFIRHYLKNVIHKVFCADKSFVLTKHKIKIKITKSNHNEIRNSICDMYWKYGV